ncbi:type II 3-dehydroquinate dehydratase [Glaciecola siphonariae]|uniref:3-dehydroquinate dehydratase n=1 Tax=Glaciecola siphonariae TaxID=521012 RepID=A0ABV9LQV6_9ALTE
MNLLLINGPNLNLLGKREPEVYGHETLADIEASLVQHAHAKGASLQCFQSNAEHALIDCVHEHMNKVDGVVINPGAYTHTSIALRDAFLGTKIPFIEVHLSNIHARETFRHTSYLSDIANGLIVGLGTLGYALAIDALIASQTK